MPKYWGKQIFTHGRFPEVGEKQKAEKKEKGEKSRWKQWPASLRPPPQVVHASTPGPIVFNPEPCAPPPHFSHTPPPPKRNHKKCFDPEPRISFTFNLIFLWQNKNHHTKINLTNNKINSKQNLSNNKINSKPNLSNNKINWKSRLWH